MKKVLSFILAFVLMVSCMSMITFAEGEINGTITGATLNIGSSLTLDYYASLSSKADVSMRFTSSSARKTTVKGVYDDASGMYKFSYTGINPQCMSDNIKAELIYNGAVLATKEEYSVKAYCESMALKSASQLNYTTAQTEALRTLLADMLTYGAEAQKYREYNTSDLANDAIWITAYKTAYATPLSVKTVEGNSDANNKVKSLGLNMANVNKIYFKLILNDDVTVKLNGETVDVSTLKKDGDAFVLYSDGIKATEFDDVYTLTIEKSGSVISTVKYNVNAYIASKSSDATVGAIVKALHNYGASAEKYVQAMEAGSIGGDFDLGEEDDLLVEESKNLIPQKASTFEGATSYSNAGWTSLGNPTLSIVNDDVHGNYLKNVPIATYSTGMFDISPYITEAGEYTISFDYMVEGSSENAKPFAGVIRTSAKTSFAQSGSDTSAYGGTGNASIIENGEWYTFTTTVTVKAEDLGVGTPWNFGVHTIEEITLEDETTQLLSAIYMDNLTLVKNVYKQTLVTTAETWVAEEITLISDKTYLDPFYDVDVDLKLTNGTTTYTVPGFWDGGDVWRIRFMCPSAGVWTYETVCTDTENTGLHGITGAVKCTEYSGDLDIYKHGFVTTSYNKNYFTYADGTPFFYLGDTHWGLGDESQYMVENIASLRAEQGYTVYQSQPIGASFNLSNGFTADDIKGFKAYDKKFQIIAKYGLVHTNSQFIFPSSMSTLIANNGGYSDVVLATGTKNNTTYTLYQISDEVDTYLEKLSRYWVARYSAYPVMWTMGQEVDRDFFWTATGNFHSHADWGYANNPYHNIAEYMAKYDPYNQPLSAHQEGSSYSNAQNSSFRNIESHTWWASQWKPSLTTEGLHTIAKTYAEYGQGKPYVNYEPYYVWLQTKNFGGRAQGWMSFLSGFSGHAYGAQDTWAFTNGYQEGESKYYDGVDQNTSEEKIAAKWTDAKEYHASFQLTYMKKFLTGTVGQWYDLIPRYDDTNYLVRDEGALAAIASTADHRKIVIYFFNFDNTEDLTVGEIPNAAGFGSATGTLKNLSANTQYNYMWFNPITAEKTYGSFTSTANGTWDIPEKAMQDMVLYVYNR